MEKLSVWSFMYPTHPGVPKMVGLGMACFLWTQKRPRESSVLSFRSSDLFQQSFSLPKKTSRIRGREEGSKCRRGSWVQVHVHVCDVAFAQFFFQNFQPACHFQSHQVLACAVRFGCWLSNGCRCNESRRDAGWLLREPRNRLRGLVS